MVRIAIGIDLGTTYSCVAAYVDGKVEIIPNEYDDHCTPSVVSFDKDVIKVGKDAKEYAVVSPENTVFEIKRIIGQPYDEPRVQEDMLRWPFEVVKVGESACIQIDDTQYRAEEISAKILEKMRSLAERRLGVVVREAVITVPAHFNNAQRQATIDAGRIAGLNVLQILVEPTAAALAYGLNTNVAKKRNVLVFDLGGGTFDVSVVTVDGDSFTVRSTDGDPHLGGGDFDERMYERFLDDFKTTNPNVDPTGDAKAMRRLRSKCEALKRQLSTVDVGSIHIDYFSGEHDLDVSMTRATFEEINADYFSATMKTVEAALVGAFMQKTDIDDIVLVGGSTRIPKVQDLLSKLFGGRQLKRNINPDEAVAYGAALRAAQLVGDTTMSRMRISDVTPLSLGVEILGGLTSVIIPKNTTTPLSKTETYTTAYSLQTELQLTVVEGESPIAADNHTLGQCIIQVNLAPRGSVEVQVTFSVDENGILKVSAVGGANKTPVILRMDYGPARLSDDQIQEMIANATHQRDLNEQRRHKNQALANLEVYCIERRYADDTTQDIIDKCQEVLTWCHQDDRTKEDIDAKLDELETLFGKISLPYE